MELYNIDKKYADNKRVCPKLSKIHVEPKYALKMRVYPMAQVNNYSELKKSCIFNRIKLFFSVI